MKIKLPLVLLGLAAGLASPARAQWLTQTLELKAGWNAVFLHVDASHTTIDALVGDTRPCPIQEIWRWNPAPVSQFISNPAQPTTSPEWISWSCTNRLSALQRLGGDNAYLVRVDSNRATYSWNIKGRPVAPRHAWTISGLNLVGFSTVPEAPPNFKTFLGQATEFLTTAPEIYSYPGGELGANNPMLIPSLLQKSVPVTRGQAFWIRSGTVFSRYFGPFEVVQSGSGGMDFRDTSSAITFRLRNLTSSNLVVTLRLVNSEPVPPLQTSIGAAPPLAVRGNILNLTNLTYSDTSLTLDSPHNWSLAPRGLTGSEVEVVLGLNRTAIDRPPGTLLAGVLRFTDSLKFSQVNLPVTATVTSSAGLWVGTATINEVSQYLPSYTRENQTNYIEAANGDRRISSIATNQLARGLDGHYLATSTNTSLAAVSRPYTGRLIVHNPTNGNAILLQRVYHGFDANTNVIVSNTESKLHADYFKNARRISSTFLPWTDLNSGWAMDGRLRQQSTLTATVALPFGEQSSNPFLHTYHPDHDNLTASFDRYQPQGVESYSIERVILLRVQPAAGDFSSKVTASETIAGDYEETITLKGLVARGQENSRQYKLKGLFNLNRISPVPTLTR